jgi:hypothetical protein
VLVEPTSLPPRLVDVVSDHAAKDRTGDTADNCTLDLVAACNRTEHCTRGGANCGVTLGVLYDYRATCRS